MKNHNFHPPDAQACVECGVIEKDHLNKCEKCGFLWYGNIEHKCPKEIQQQ